MKSFSSRCGLENSKLPRTGDSKLRFASANRHDVKWIRDGGRIGARKRHVIGFEFRDLLDRRDEGIEVSLALDMGARTVPAG